MSGFTLRCLDQDADRISVQSSHGPTFWCERRKYRWMPAQARDVGLTQNEVVILKSRALNRITMTAQGGDLCVQSTRRATIYLPKGREKLITLGSDETLIIRSPDARDPTRGHRIPSEDEIERGLLP